jgi:hypothetical protein
MPKFEVGEIALLYPIDSQTPHKENLRLKGEECEVTELPKLIPVKEMPQPVFAYRVKLLKDGVIYIVFENELKKIIPPEMDAWAHQMVKNVTAVNPEVLYEPEALAA